MAVAEGLSSSSAAVKMRSSHREHSRALWNPSAHDPGDEPVESIRRRVSDAESLFSF